ncbi:MotA/TolQ/ExbB proton channel family protein [Nitratiruptor sp. YY09-18]|uniref:MotA/TolQ/ExbB proton channel family protein n=1 Tax=Nitratiruptor sp. YY09-18 TaxID=2724901 RepID=UPI0019165444|nr:MotA/TolQ/ExbB proton channel family protein [Nitratiruptor sp. YY09-18]BCD67784.1 MotA/TolQ/ExbB proton channel family protein [Nitratiruptor sp. YY09-18]
MKQFDLLVDYLQNSNYITIAVLGVLSLYFIIVNWIFLYRYIILSLQKRNEAHSLHTIQMGNKKPALNSFLHRCLQNRINEQTGEYCIFKITNESTKGLTFLSIAASTSPFIGLLGTVVSILETFYIMGSTKASLASISASIGEALIATAAGIFVAIFSYTYHLILKRKAFELVSFVKMQLDLLLGR